MAAPLYSHLRKLADASPLRLNMPGHHGKPLSVENLADTSLDLTETGRTGDLFTGGDIIEEAERLWAERFGMGSCLFLTGGSTQGIHTGLALLAGPGGTAAVDRGSHRAVWNAMALLGLTPRYLVRPWLDGEGVTGPIEPDEVEQLLEQNPEIKTVCVTSPTYYGVLSDIPAIARVCHRRGARLMVDGAHGAHLPFLGYTGYSAADAVVVSAHKTLPALGQSALLFANGFSMDELRRLGSVYGSSSPSYLLMASMDLARDWMEREGTAAYEKTAAMTARLRARFPALSPGPLELDPTRLTVRCADGFALAERLQKREIDPEMADRNHVVFILTAAETEADEARLTAALEDLLTGDVPPADLAHLRPPELPEQATSPRSALFAPRKAVPLDRSEGEISACQIAPYPPGVPVIGPGERIGKKHLAYLRKIGYNRSEAEILISK